MRPCCWSDGISGVVMLTQAATQYTCDNAGQWELQSIHHIPGLPPNPAKTYQDSPLSAGRRSPCSSPTSRGICHHAPKSRERPALPAGSRSLRGQPCGTLVPPCVPTSGCTSGLALGRGRIRGRCQPTISNVHTRRHTLGGVSGDAECRTNPLLILQTGPLARERALMVVPGQQVGRRRLHPPV